jgi:hypothetical protein
MLDNLHDMPGDDPVFWLEHMAAFPGAVTIDHDCAIFQNCGQSETVWDWKLQVLTNGTVFNTQTGKYPCILHFDSGYSDPKTGKWSHIEKYWKALGNTERPPWENQ